MKQPIKLLIALLVIISCLVVDAVPGNAKSDARQQIFSRINTSQKVVALTFDDGPDPVFTPQVLDILKQYGIPATFFVVGNKVVEHLDIIQHLVKDGHQVENHTYTHPNMQAEKLAGVQREIVDAQTVIRAATGREPVFFRPPRKLYNQQVLDVALSNGLTTVLWGICVENSACPTPAQMAQRVLEHAEPGLIILAHDGLLDRSRTVQALPLIIQGLKELGYQFVTLDTMVNSPATTRLKV